MGSDCVLVILSIAPIFQLDPLLLFVFCLFEVHNDVLYSVIRSNILIWEVVMDLSLYSIQLCIKCDIAITWL